MTVDLIQLGYYAGFAVLGWWLRHRGVLAGPSQGNPSPVPVLDQQTLVQLLKALLDRLAQSPGPSAPAGAPNVFHVPIEVSASPKPPVPGIAP